MSANTLGMKILNSVALMCGALSADAFAFEDVKGTNSRRAAREILPAEAKPRGAVAQKAEIERTFQQIRKLTDAERQKLAEFTAKAALERTKVRRAQALRNLRLDPMQRLNQLKLDEARRFQDLVRRRGLAVAAPKFVVAPSAVSTPAIVESGVALKTDEDLNRLLRRADEFAETGRYDLAIILWQKVLDDSTGTVMSRDEWLFKTMNNQYRKYRSVADEIERSIATLPPAGLRTYRAKADGEAKAILAATIAEDRAMALAEVVRRFFLSSYGDDAAFELACLNMEQYEFISANRLLNKLLDEYPDSNISPEQILMRLAVANARIGDRKSAQSALSRLTQTAAASAFEHVLSLVKIDLQRSHGDSVLSATSPKHWHLRFGNPTRSGSMPALPENIISTPLTELWSKDFELQLSSLSRGTASRTTALQPLGNPVPRGNNLVFRGRNRVVMNNGAWALSTRFPSGTTRTALRTVTPEFMIQRWKTAGWRPAGQILLSNGRVYFKNKDRLVCCDQSGEMIWMGRRNRYSLDALSQFVLGRQIASAAANAASIQPGSESEIGLFGDRIRHSMSIAANLLLNVEGTLLEFGSISSTKSSQPIFRTGASLPRRTRTNWLSAYDAKNGKLKWYRSASDESTGPVLGVGFLAAPIPYVNLLLAPVAKNGELWIYAMSPVDGQTVWKTFLCDEPSGGCSQWSPVGIAVDGGDAYVASGAGAVFALDAPSGSLRWVIGYSRSLSGTIMGPRSNGFQDDVVTPHGRQLVVMASDYDQLFALDRRTGELLWESPRIPSADDPPSEYYVGAAGRDLYVAGKNVVRQYETTSGRLMWETTIADSLGRAMLTEDRIYVPVEETVVGLDLKTGQKLGEVQVVLPNREPLGNLYSDGTRLIVHGMGRIYALAELQRHLDKLTTSIAQGDGLAQFARMRLFARLGKTEEAVRDLRDGYQSLVDNQEFSAAGQELYDGIEHLKLAGTQPLMVFELLRLARSDTRADGHIPEATRAELDLKQSDVLYDALAALHAQGAQGMANSIMEIADLCTEERLLTAARRAMAITVDKNDTKLLREALKSQDVNVRAVAVSGLSVTMREQSAAEMKEMLTASDSNLRLVAATNLANQGDSDALPVLGDLLTSAELQVRLRAVLLLRALTGKRFNYSARDPVYRRDKATTDWQAWIGSEGKLAKLIYPLDESSLLLGRTLFANYRSGRVTEVDSKGRTIWDKQIQGAFACHGLPNGNRLISSYTSRNITEYDATGRIVWSAQVEGQPFGVRRLPNGNTLVACYNNGKVQEIRPDTTVAWEVALPQNPTDARRLSNGHTLVTLMSGGRVAEVDTTGKVVWEYSGLSNPRSAQRLPNGNTLICESGRGRVIEVDRQRQIIWSRTGLRNPVDAQRVANGNTLIADYSYLTEIDDKGKIVWRKSARGIGRISRF